LFRYPEKLVGPASLLLALAAAAGAQRLLADRGAARRALVAAAAAAGVLLALRGGIHLWHDELVAWLVEHGRTRAGDPAQMFAGALSRALLVEAALAAGLAIACALRERRDLLAALVCAASSLLCGAGQLVTAPRELLEARAPLADLLVARAGPSEGAWRIESDTEQSLVLPGLDARLRRAAWSAQVLAPRTNAVQRIESVSGYGSLEDERYRLAQSAAPGVFRAVLGVRFTVRMPWEPPRGPGWTQGPYGMWIHEQPVLPRAFLVAHAVRTAEPLTVLRDPAFDPARDAVTSQVALDEPGPGGEAQMVRESPERIRVRVEAPGPRLLVVASTSTRAGAPAWTAPRPRCGGWISARSASSCLRAPRRWSFVTCRAGSSPGPSVSWRRSRSWWRSASVDIGLQLLDEDLLVVEHQLDDVAHGDDADHAPLLILDEKMAGVVGPHQLRRLRLAAVRPDAGQVGPHRFADGHRSVVAGRQHPRYQVALGDDADHPAAFAHGDRSDLLVAHHLRGLAAGRQCVERNQRVGDVPFDGGHARLRSAEYRRTGWTWTSTSTG